MDIQISVAMIMSLKEPIIWQYLSLKLDFIKLSELIEINLKRIRWHCVSNCRLAQALLKKGKEQNI